MQRGITDLPEEMHPALTSGHIAFGPLTLRVALRRCGKQAYKVGNTGGLPRLLAIPLGRRPWEGGPFRVGPP